MSRVGLGITACALVAGLLFLPAAARALDAIVVLPSGFVGIGVTTPVSLLQVGYGEIRFPPAADGLGLTHFNYPDGKNYIRGTTVIADNGGNVGIGCTTPDYKLTIGNTTPSCGGTYSKINPGSPQFTYSSSRSIKENLEAVAVPDLLERIESIGVYHFDFIDGPKDRLGLMAEDFHRVFRRGSDRLIDGQDVEMALWLAVQELAARNRDLSERVAGLNELRASNEELRQRLNALEAQLGSLVSGESTAALPAQRVGH